MHEQSAEACKDGGPGQGWNILDFNAIRDHLISIDGLPRAPAQPRLLDTFERHHGVTLPVDVRRSYSIMNGADDATDPNTSWIRFWPIEEWQPASQVYPNDEVLKSVSSCAFICADFGIECVHYVIDLDKVSPTFGHVYGVGATRPGLVATSFSGFIAKVLEDSGDLHNYG